MPKLYAPFPLKSADIVKDYVRNFFKNHNSEQLYAVGLPLPKDILDIVDRELISYGLPKSTSCMAFKRKLMLMPNYKDCHVDYSPTKKSTIKTSLVIPIEGCKDTCMYWAEGDYVTWIAKVSPFQNLKGMDHYMKVLWRNAGSILDQVEIFDTPMLCRVDVPHSATSRQDGSYRLIMSIRFDEDLDIEEMLARRSSMDRTILS